ncbi:MAG: extracellular solute-binding protein [Anaerolineales bacterium]
MSTDRPDPLATDPSASPVSGPATNSVDVTVWLGGSPPDLASFGQRAEAFSSEHPEVRFHLSFYGPDELLPALAGVASSERPTILIGPSMWGPDLLQSGQIHAIPGVSLAEPPPGMLPVAWESVESDGVVFGIPLSLSGNVWYRNLRLAPDPSPTVEDWVSAGMALRGPEAVGAALDLSYLTIAPWFWACHGSVQALDAHVVIEVQAGPCWIRLVSLIAGAGTITSDAQGDRQVFLDGRAGWLIDDTQNDAEILSALGPDFVRVDPWPVYGLSGLTIPGFVWTEAAFLVSDSDPAQLTMAAAFLDSLIQPDSQEALLNTPGTRWRTVRTDLGAIDPWKDQLLEVLRSGVLRPVLSGIPPEAEILERAARAVAVQRTEPELAWQTALDSYRLLITPTAP